MRGGIVLDEPVRVDKFQKRWESVSKKPLPSTGFSLNPYRLQGSKVADAKRSAKKDLTSYTRQERCTLPDIVPFEVGYAAPQ